MWDSIVLVPYHCFPFYVLYPATLLWRGIMIYLRCPYVRPYVRPSAPFTIDNWSICSWIFFKFCIHIVIRDEWYGIVIGQNPSIFNRVTAFVHTGKIVSGILILCYLRYLNETSHLCLSSKVTYCDKEPSRRLFQFISYLPLVDSKNVFDLLFHYYMDFLNETSQIY